jgi:hypothetical protein
VYAFHYKSITTGAIISRFRQTASGWRTASGTRTSGTPARSGRHAVHAVWRERTNGEKESYLYCFWHTRVLSLYQTSVPPRTCYRNLHGWLMSPDAFRKCQGRGHSWASDATFDSMQGLWELTVDDYWAFIINPLPAGIYVGWKSITFRSMEAWRRPLVTNNEPNYWCDCHQMIIAKPYAKADGRWLVDIDGIKCCR